MAIKTPYDSLTLMAVAGELQISLVGGVVQHIAQPEPTDLILTIRNRGENRLLLLSCGATHARVHLVASKPPNPPAPPSFCMICRKYLEGAKVASVKQRGGDRILDLSFTIHDENRFLLTAELMGKHSNLVLVGESGTVLDSIKHVTHKMSRHRELLPGVSYHPPPAQAEKTDPFTVSSQDIEILENELPQDNEARSAWFMSHFESISPFLANELAARSRLAPLAEVWNDIFGKANRREWLPVVIRSSSRNIIGAYPFPSVQFSADNQNQRLSVNVALDHFYSMALPHAEQDALHHEIEGELNRAQRAREKQLANLLAGVAESERADEFRQTGELIVSNLYQIEDGANHVVVTDYYNSETAEKRIELNPMLTPHENAETWFKRYRKAKDGKFVINQQRQRIEQELSLISEAKQRLSECGNIDALKALRIALTTEGLLRQRQSPTENEPGKQKRHPEFDGKKIRVYHTEEGYDIYLGETAEANDYLTSRVAAPNDIWLHVRSNTSAHVVIRTANNPKSVPRTVIELAARLSAQHSAAKHSSTVPVDYTLKKYVRKPRGAAPGTVLYQNEKTIYVTPES